MNTLNYKALLIKTSLLVFIRALGIYLLMTLPVLGVPPLYIMSAGFALSFGWIAGIFFLLGCWLLQKLTIAPVAKQVLLYTIVAVAVLVAFQMIDVLGAWENVWASGGLLLFPAAAVIAGWISLAVSKNNTRNLFVRVTTNYYDAMIDDKLSATAPVASNNIF